MMRAPPFIRRWLEAHANALGRKHGRIRPLSREEERVNAYNRERRLSRTRTQPTTEGE